MSTYEEQRRAENRSDCTYCGMSDERCTQRVLDLKPGCCAMCITTDTHPMPRSVKINAHSRLAAMRDTADASGNRGLLDAANALAEIRELVEPRQYDGHSSTQVLARAVMTAIDKHLEVR